MDWTNWVDWLQESPVAVPILVAVGSMTLGLWARRVLVHALERWAHKVRWEAASVIIDTTHRASLLWLALLSIYIGLHVSRLSPERVALAGKGLASLFIISAVAVVTVVAERMLRPALAREHVPESSISLLINVIRVIASVVTVLVLLDMWGAPVAPILVVLAALVVIGIISLRDTMPNLIAGFQLVGEGKIKEGEFIRLESGEEGYVVGIGRSTTAIETVSHQVMLIPNSKIVRTTVTNYGRPLKQAKEPFHFFSHVHLHELTGLKATNLKELVDVLKDAPDSVVYYHTHNYLEEQQYLTPLPPNDFAPWVSDALGDEILGEKLASIDTVGFPTLAALRRRIVNVIEEHLPQADPHRRAAEGREFHFLKSLSIVTRTSYVAHDLREFVEALRMVPANSLYYHMFESRLRLARGMNDFSIWLADSLDEKDLADAIVQLDPYHYTLEGLRSTIIQLIEKRIK